MVDRRTKTDVLGGLSRSRFLRDYWQKKPLLVRGAFPAFRDPASPDELAGLACEDGVESRLVVRRRTRWSVEWGPFAESRFGALPERDWTLLVQEVNRWVPEAALLLDEFDFIPNVRVDDVMVSYAEPGGGVGPHLDSYDVFLVQGKGQRRWRYHTAKTKETRFVPGLDLRILETFEPDADEVLGPGDLLYLPPGFAHHGVAVTPCLTYSIGFRAPSLGEAWTAFARAAAAGPRGAELLEDPRFDAAAHPGEIPPALLARVRRMVRSIDMSDAAIDAWFAAYATRLKPDHGLTAPSRPPDERALLSRLAEGDVVARSEEARWAYLPAGGGLSLYVGGEQVDVPRGAVTLVRALAARRRHDGRALAALAKTRPARAVLVRLFAMGALRFAQRRGAPRS